MAETSVSVKYLVSNQKDEEWGTTVNSVGYQHIDPGQEYPPRNHPSGYFFKTQKGRLLNEYQLIYITGGSGKFVSTSCDQKMVSQGTMFLLFPREWHSYSPQKSTGWDEYWIGFNSKSIHQRIDALFFSKEKPVLNVGLQNDLTSLFLQAISIAQEQRPGYQQQLAGIVEYMLGSAYSYNRSSMFEESKVIREVNKAKVLIMENIHTKILPEEVAAKLNISYSKFRKIFKEYTGFSPMNYINEVKIQKSKELLTNTELTGVEIAYQLGFYNTNYFCTLFKNKTKMTPIEYRFNSRGKTTSS